MAINSQLIVVFLAAAPLVLAVPESPVGFIQSASGGSVILAGSRSPIPAKAGFFLFTGDTLDGPENSISFAYCPRETADAKLLFQLKGRVTLGLNPPPWQGAQLDICALPDLERLPPLATLPPIADILPEMANGAPPVDRRQIPDDKRSTIEPLLQRDLSAPRVRLALGVALQNAGMMRAAAQQYAAVLLAWKASPPLQQLILDLTRADTRGMRLSPAQDTTAEGKVFALVVGISSYEQNRIPDLHYAAADAKGVAEYLSTPRGGTAKVKKLTDADATAGAIRNYFNDINVRAGANDTVVLFIAAHGDMDGDNPIVITHRANPQDTGINGFPMAEIQSWIANKEIGFKRVQVFLDVCHAGHAAEFQVPTRADHRKTELLMLLATHQGPDAFAYESPVFGGGHGAFTYFLLRGLNGPEAKAASANFVTASGLAKYVGDRVSDATGGKQLPSTKIGVNLGTEVADLDKPGLKDFDSTPLDQIHLTSDQLRGLRKLTRTASPKKVASSTAPAATNLPRRISLENQGEEILLQYLKGDEARLIKDDFDRCERIYREALTLQEGSPYLEARRSFCEGRAAIFEKDYATAEARIGDSIRLDPAAAYGYNAIGIAWLEQSNFTLAASAFEDAIQRAPKWAYPRHNLALLRMQTGDYDLAESDYKEAMRLAPDYFYPAYGLGLLYQRTNRLAQASEMYKLASRLAPDRAEPWNGLGSVDLLRSKWRRAESYFRKALTLPNQLQAAVQSARHNLGLALDPQRKRRSEALNEWTKNGAYLPSVFKIAESAERSARENKWRNAEANEQAVDSYRTAVAAAPEELSARRAFAEVLEKTNRRSEAAREYEEVSRLSPADANAYLRAGTLYLALEKWPEACRVFEAGLRIPPGDSVARKKLQAGLDTCSPHVSR